jgi:hypothetical protein
MSQENVEVVRGLYEKWGDGDLLSEQDAHADS